MGAEVRMTQLETKRLILRPFQESDAADLYEYAKDPRVGPIAGWPVHTSVENSREIIRTVFAAPHTFAVADRETGRVIGSAGFTGQKRADLPVPNDELGYALSPAFWGRGLMPEAAAELLRYGFEELGLACIWCSHYTQNSQSRRVIEKCGFVHFLDGAVLDEPTGEERPARFYALTREQWAEQNGGR